MSTHNLCFVAKIRKIGIRLHTLVLLYKWGIRGYTFQGHVFVMSKSEKRLEILAYDVVIMVRYSVNTSSY